MLPYSLHGLVGPPYLDRTTSIFVHNQQALVVVPTTRWSLSTIKHKLKTKKRKGWKSFTSNTKDEKKTSLLLYHILDLCYLGFLSLDFCIGISIFRFPSWDFCIGISIFGFPSWYIHLGISILGISSWDFRFGISILVYPSWDFCLRISIFTFPSLDLHLWICIFEFPSLDFHP